MSKQFDMVRWKSTDGTLEVGPGNFKYLKFSGASGGTERLISDEVLSLKEQKSTREY